MAKHYNERAKTMECKECATCDYWNNKLNCCDFSGICEYPVNPKFLNREYSLLEH